MALPETEGWATMNDGGFARILNALADELGELTEAAERRRESWPRLGDKLDRLCEFIRNEDNERAWSRRACDTDTRAAARRLREASARALGVVEKARAWQIYTDKRAADPYTALLSAATRGEWERVGTPRGAKVMFVGAGAFPVSAFTIAAETAAEVLCVDIDEEAVRHGTKLARYLGLTRTFRYTGSHLGEPEFASSATHVFIASLVPEKLDILRELRFCVRPDCRVVVRYGNGLKSLFNYPLDVAALTDWRAAEPGGAGSLYDTAILEPRTTAYEAQLRYLVASGT
ncbi:hypothetical protein ACFQBN_09905 [Cohnella cellulosilytica]